MSQIVIPDETLLRAPELWVPGRKPVGPVKIDAPFAVYDMWLFGSQWTHSVRGRPMSYNAPGGSVLEPFAFNSKSSTGNDEYIHLGVLPVKDWSGATFILGFSDLNGASQPAARLFAVYHSVSGLDDIRIYHSSDTSVVVSWDDGTITNQTISVQDKAYGLSADNNIAITNDGSTQRAFFNGRLIEESLQTYNFSANNGQTYVAGSPAQSRCARGVYYYLIALPFAAPQPLAQSLALDPFQILRPA